MECKYSSLLFDFRLKEGLPAGKAFICMDVADLPMIMKQIFTSSFLNSNT